MVCGLPDPNTGAIIERPAITTRLSCDAFCSLYPECNLAPWSAPPGALQAQPCLTTFKTVDCLP